METMLAGAKLAEWSAEPAMWALVVVALPAVAAPWPSAKLERKEKGERLL